MFVPSSRTFAKRAQAAAGWLRAFAFLEDGRAATPHTVSEPQLLEPAARATRTDHVSTSRSNAHGAVETSFDLALRVQTAEARPSSHVHRRPLRPALRKRRPGVVVPRPMPCLTPLPPRPVARPALSSPRSDNRAVTRRTAP